MAKRFADTYICSEQSDPVGMSQPAEDDGEEGLVELIRDADQLCPMHQAGFYRCVPSHVCTNYFVSSVSIVYGIGDWIHIRCIYTMSRSI